MADGHGQQARYRGRICGQSIGSSSQDRCACAGSRGKKNHADARDQDDPDITLDIPSGAVPATQALSSVSAAPTITYEKLRVRIENANDIDVLDADASLIGTIEGPDRQNNLAQVYKSRRAELRGA